MISVSAFGSSSALAERAAREGFALEFMGLVEPRYYPEKFLENVRKTPGASCYHAAHGPFFDLLPASCDEEVSALARGKFLRAIEACGKLQIRHLVLHNGWIPGFYSRAKWIENAVRFWRDLVARAGGAVTIHLENVMESGPEIIGEIVRCVDSPFFDACLDVGHANIFSRGNISLWIRTLGSRIGHVHLHNNFGVEDEHLGLTTGVIDMEQVYGELKECCPRAVLNLEIRGDMEESLAMIRRLEERGG